MSAADTIRALMADGRARKPADICRDLRLSMARVRPAIRRMAAGKGEPILIRIPSPPALRLAHPNWTRQNDHGRGYLYRINPNCRDVIAVNTEASRGA